MRDLPHAFSEGNPRQVALAELLVKPRQAAVWVQQDCTPTIGEAIAA